MKLRRRTSWDLTGARLNRSNTILRTREVIFARLYQNIIYVVFHLYMHHVMEDGCHSPTSGRLPRHFEIRTA